MTTATVTPVKGLVYKHALRRDYAGEPKVFTVTSIRPHPKSGVPLVYSKDNLGQRIKTRVSFFDKVVAEVVAMPEPKAPSTTPKLTEAQMRGLVVKAHSAGVEAAEAAVPTPMVVQERENPFDDNSPIVRQYAPVMSGVVGFAWVSIYPATSTFARWLKKNGRARPAYQGGLQIWVSGYGQSYERKMAYAGAYARVLTEAGFKAYAGGRLD